jgi:hypothetical protein
MIMMAGEYGHEISHGKIKWLVKTPATGYSNDAVS